MVRIKQFVEKRSNILSIYESMKPVYIWCKFFGMNPLQETPEEITLKDKWYQNFYFIFYLTLYTFLLGYTSLKAYQNEISLVGNQYILLAECCFSGLLSQSVVIFTFFFRNLLLKTLKTLSEIDTLFEKLHIDLNYKHLKKNSYIILRVLIFQTTLKLIFMFLALASDPLVKISLTLASVLRSSTKYQFLPYILHFKLRFTKINEAIRSLAESGKIVLNPETKSIPDKLQPLCTLHYKLAYIMEKVNSAFAPKMLISIAVSLFDILFNSYCIYYTFTAKNLDVLLMVGAFIWLLEEIVEIYWLVGVCSKTCEEANETPVVLHELRNILFDEELDAYIQSFSLQLLHQKVEFSILGFFVVDYTLIYSMVGVVTTYLVIFIQFDQSSKSDEDLFLNGTSYDN